MTNPTYKLYVTLHENNYKMKFLLKRIFEFQGAKVKYFKNHRFCCGHFYSHYMHSIAENLLILKEMPPSCMAYIWIIREQKITTLAKNIKFYRCILKNSSRQRIYDDFRCQFWVDLRISEIFMIFEKL